METCDWYHKEKRSLRVGSLNYSITYLEKKRALVSVLLDNHEIETVLDFGCGNGEAFLVFLSSKYKNINFTGFDPDERNTLLLSELKVQVKIAGSVDELTENRYDLILLTEVLEHVNAPEELIFNLCKLLTSKGVLFVTIPNGFGLNEWMSSFWGIFTQAFARRRAIGNDRFTMSSSPHVNFFGLRQLDAMFRNTAVEVITAGNVVYMHSAPFRWLTTKFERFRRLNFSGLNRTPARYADDWFFVLKPRTPRPSQNEAVYKTGMVTRIRRKANVMRSRR